MADVLDPLGRAFNSVRRATAFTLIGGVIGDNDETRLGQRLAIDIPSGLLLAASKRVNADNGRICPPFIKAGRQQDVGCNRPCHVGILTLDRLHLNVPRSGLHTCYVSLV